MGFLFSFISLLICSKTPIILHHAQVTFKEKPWKSTVLDKLCNYCTVLACTAKFVQASQSFCNALRSLFQHIEYSGNLWVVLKRKVSKLGFLNATSATGYVAFYVLFSLTVRAIPHLILAVCVSSHNTD